MLEENGKYRWRRKNYSWFGIDIVEMECNTLLDVVYTGGESLQDWLRDVAQRCVDLLNNLGFSLCAVPSVCLPCSHNFR